MRISDWSSDVCSSDLLFEQNHVQTASMHLTITLQGLPTIAGHAATHPPTVNSNAPMLVVLPPRQDLPEVPMSAQRLPAMALPESAQPQPTNIHRGRSRLLDKLAATHNLRAIDYAKLAGKTRRWLRYENTSGNLLGLSVGHPDRR